MRYCSRCILPDTRPNLVIGPDGVCNACQAHGTKRDIDWSARRRLFAQVAEHARSRSRGYDCVIPVSGGKDSTWQVVTCLEHGLNPLAVTWRTPARTEVGERNLRNLVRIGVDHIDYQVNPRVEARFMVEAFRKHGSTAIPMHLALFSIPTAIAARFDIPLVIWGENSAFEYGGTEGERTGFNLDAAWLRKFGVTHGTTAEDWVGAGLSRRDLTPYFSPTEEELSAAGVLAVFLGYYFEWDPETTYRVARQHGFAQEERARTGYYAYADIDDDFISIHHHMKWYKFGFTRLFDNLSLEIRNGRMRREEAVRIVAETGDQTPHADIDKFCAFAGLPRAEFDAIAETFRDIDVWEKRNGIWRIRDFLIPDWRWT
jgi:N-acetyl sugar amidotransferase